MSNIAKKQMSKIFAGLLAIIMMLSLTPAGVYVTAFAAEVSEYSVKVVDETNQPITASAVITLTNKADTQKTMTETAASGVAVFKSFVEENAEYSVAVTSAVGYADVADRDLAVAEGDTETTIRLTALEKVTISGIVKDENGEPYQGAKVSLTGYHTAEVTTGVDGAYSFQVFKGKSYTVTATAKEAKYQETSMSKDFVVDDETWPMSFAVKKYTIQTTASENGTITAEETVNYGEKRTITATANDGYCIGAFTVNGTAQENAQGQRSFAYEIDSAEKNYDISVAFVRKTYKITFTVGENGQVAYADGSEQTVPGGSIAVEKLFEESTDPANPKKVEIKATPAENYRVSKVKVDDLAEEVFSENNKGYTKELVMTADHTFVVEFAPNIHSVTADVGENGTVRVKKEKVNYGSEALVEIQPDDGYNIESVTVNGTETTAYTINDDGKFYNLKITVTGDVEVKATFSAISSISWADAKVSFTDAKYENGGRYVYANGTGVTFATELGGIKVNGIGAHNEQSAVIYKSTDITEIQVYNALKWYKVDSPTGSDPIRIVINVNAQVVKMDSNELAWTNAEKVTISGNVTDEDTPETISSGESYVVWSKGEELTREKILVSTNKANINTDGKFSFDIKGEDQNSVYYIYAVDVWGNISGAATVQVRIDRTAPTIQGFTFSTKENSVLQDAIHILSFGLFCNEKLYVTVEAEDKDPSSGLKEITLYAGDEAFETKETQDGKCTFVLPADEVDPDKVLFNNSISATATDNAGNTTKEKVFPTVENSTVSNVMIETVKPTLSISVPKPAEDRNPKTADENDWYNGDIDFEIQVGDTDSGIASVKAALNKKDVLSYTPEKTDGKVTSKEFKVNTKNEKEPADGKFELSVTVVDNAGNSETKTKTVYKDITAPAIDRFEFNHKDYQEGSNTAVEKTAYGFYFKEETTVTIYAKDVGASAGIKSITYYTVDYTENAAGEKSTETTLDVDEGNKVSFTVPANFKGQIYAKATDNVSNTSENFVNPDGMIVESKEKHDGDTHITFQRPNTALKTAAKDNNDLYAGDTEVTITVMDTYSGIRGIEWSVVGNDDPNNNQSGSVTVDNAGKIVEENTGWEIINTDENLVCVMQKTITVTNDSNDIVVSVKMTDRAGNESSDSTTFSIDKTKPTIAVTYDNTTPDSEYTSFYKEDRTATITITDRNFDANAVNVAIGKDGEKVSPAPFTWTSGENNTHSTTIPFTADGDYTLDVSCSDLAKNAAEPFAQHQFTIDKTNPTVAVSYDNMSAMNGNYFKAERTATITIVEHNFDASRVSIIGTAADNGADVAFPALSDWANNGDIHTATIHYAADARYSFAIACNDKAGNALKDEYVPEEFYVDKTAPVIEIGGVADRSANNGAVAPVITFTDTNYDANAVTYTLTGVNNGTVTYASGLADIANGQTVTFADFERVQKVDDIYTLTATMTDKAGNETSKSITFSANRFGSVYDLATITKLMGKYLQSEEDVVFTEINVDSLRRGETKLKLTMNGTPRDLVEGTDYTVAETGGNGLWSQYRYTLRKALFADDGRYSVSVYSVDAAGNINENIDETKKAEISFGIDKTEPVIVPIDFESNTQYPVELKTVSVEIKDNLVLEDVKVYLNGEEIKYSNQGETYTFDIPEKNEKQNVRIVAVDAAGNELEVLVEDFLVSTNVFVRWFNNTPLFIGSIAGAAILCGAIVFLTKSKRKKVEV